MITPGAAVGLAAGLSLTLTPLVRRLALRLGITDTPDERRVHLRPTARAGGVAVATAVVTALALGAGVPELLGPPVLTGAAFLLIVGVADDVFSLRAETKLAAQLMAALLAVAGGLRLHLLGAAPVGAVAVLEAALTVVWIVLIINAFNLSDGLDGLAAGMGAIGLLALGAAVMRGGDASAALPCFVIAAALAGFLVYNSHPATVFLGDAGSLGIGYALAVLPLALHSSAAVPPLAAFLLVAVPATDTFIAIARRFLSRCLPPWGDGFFWRGIREGLLNMVRPDRRHVHHRILDLGFSQRRAVLLLYAAAAVTSGLAYLVTGWPTWPVDLVALGLTVTVIWLVQALGFDELRPARSGLVLPVLRRLARRRRLVVPADFCLVALAYGGALELTGGYSMTLPAAMAAVGLMAGTQLATFAAFDIYRMAWWAASVSDFGLLLRACATGTIGGYMATRLLGLPAGGDAALVHFFLLLPPVTVMRFSHALLSQGVRGESQPEPALICGTSTEARHAVGRLRRDGLGVLEPIGFVELRPRLQGRRLGRLPVLGTLDALGGIVRERRVQHLIIADPTLRGEALAWVRAMCRHLGVQVHRYVEKLVPSDGLLDQLRIAPDLAASWSVLGELFKSLSLDACVLASPGGDGAFGVPAWRRTPGTTSSLPPTLAALHGPAGLAEIVPHLNGRPTVFRHGSEGWLALAPAAAQAGDVVAVPVRCHKALWAVLLAAPRAEAPGMTPSDVARLRAATDLLGRQVERWTAATSAARLRAAHAGAA